MRKIDLREITEADVALLYRLYQDKSSMRYFGRAPSQSEQEVADVIAENLNWRTEKIGVRYLAFDGVHFLGFISLKRYDTRFQRAEIDYIIAPEVRQQGFGTRILQAFLQRAFVEWRLARLSAYVNPENLPSQKLLEKCGFQREGLLKNWDGIDGDCYIYGFTKESK
ncbi:GNAT family N-acetyltransferase [Lactococcus nasutitermitis]|uniref:GNAT family N-acetyltransferase n=1 Tax=Lactococcus nasutitermitis TaxID=1652957 RepID=A0ABV9JFM0_9LACT|nr:GNAT family protein [Lactococcus nasutitermitis]